VPTDAELVDGTRPLIADSGGFPLVGSGAGTLLRKLTTSRGKLGFT